jgi:hypothetical protein
MLFKALIMSALALSAAGPLAAGDTVAVLSSASGVYMEAFAAFQHTYGEKVEYFDISAGKPVIPSGTRTVVAFGSMAAGHSYPPGLNLVYALAPGFTVGREGRSGAIVKITMLADPDLFLGKLKKIQPSLKRLRVFWKSPSYSGLREEYAEASARAGIEITAIKVNGDGELPGIMRAARGQADAILLPPDPLLISDSTFPFFTEFSRANSVPLYVSTRGLALKGAAAAVGAGFAQAGTAAAEAAAALRDGKPLPSRIYPKGYQITLNAPAARACGLIFGPELIREADYYLP